MKRWDLFCRVVDNFGDIGTCWRLARQLVVEHAACVRLWVDDLPSFARMCSSVSTDADVQFVDSIEVRRWTEDFPSVDVADVVIEAFACELPASYIAAMSVRPVPPVWINLEYLTAEHWAEECHLLTSPHPHFRLTKHFFFPGFTSKTGGLLRERHLLASRAEFSSLAADEFWLSLGVEPKTDDELRVSLFCYENPALAELLQIWSEGPNNVRVLVAPGAATEQVSRVLGCELALGTPQRHKHLTVQAIPFLSQPDFDRLLWSCDLNFVRGEDSFVRAQWAQRPFVWQIYPQKDDVHLGKLDAFLAKYLENFDDSDAVRRFWTAWNGTGKVAETWQKFLAIRESVERLGKDWAGRLDRTSDLANNLAIFVCEK